MEDNNTATPVTLEQVQELINTTVNGLAARQQKEFVKMMTPITEQLTGFKSQMEAPKDASATEGGNKVDPKIAVMEKQLKDLQTARDTEQLKARKLEKENALSKALSGYQFANEVSRDTAFKTFIHDLDVTSDGQFVLGDEPLDTAVKGRMSHLSGLLAPKNVGGSGASAGTPRPVESNEIKPGQSKEYYQELFNRLRG